MPEARYALHPELSLRLHYPHFFPDLYSFLEESLGPAKSTLPPNVHFFLDYSPFLHQNRSVLHLQLSNDHAA
jgi:hypothetical protein